MAGSPPARVVVRDLSKRYGAVDPQSRRGLHRVIGELRASGRTVLLGTHSIEEAEQLCDRVAILDRGRIVALARPAELIARTAARPRMFLRTRIPLPPSLVQNLPGVVQSERQADGWLVTTEDVNSTVVALGRREDAEKNALVDLQVRQPSLEDAFIELTGRKWSPEEGA